MTTEIDSTFDISGDIIITDPCYLDNFSISNSHSRGTIYGDWSCTVWKMNPEAKIPVNIDNPIGQFCADSGMVTVADISKSGDKESIRDWFKERPWCGTIIDNFKGKVEYVIEHEDGEDSLIIRGTGTKDDKPFAFITRQTGL